MNWLPVSKVLLTLLSLVLALVSIEELLAGPSLSSLSWQVVSGGISSGWTLVLPQLVFSFSLKSMLIGGTDMLYSESGEERSISQANETYWSSAQWSKSQFWSEVHRFAGHHKLMVSLVWKILLTCGVTSSGFTILLMAQLPQTCLLLTLASLMMFLIGYPSWPKWLRWP